MFEAINAIAMIIGYGAIAFAVLWVLGQRRKDKWQDTLRRLENDNAERWQHFKKTDPSGWNIAESVIEGRRMRNDERRAEIARLQSEMEYEH